MPTTSGDLINLNTLVLTDTFNTWLNRTNQIIDGINPLQVYDVDVGAGSTAYETGAGLAKYTGEVAGNYNGVITLGLNPGPGIGYESLSGQSRAIIDFDLFDNYGRVLSGTGNSGSSQRVASNDEILVNDVSDTSNGKSQGNVKKIQARYMLPPEVAMDVLTISGDVVIRGSLSTLGANDFIASNNLRIEDKQIELAYQQSVGLGMTGVTSGSFTAGNLGATAYYFVDGTTTVPYFYGHLQSFTAAPAGPTGVLYLGALFQDPYGPEDVGATGYISLSSTGSTRFEFDSNLGITSSFLNNASLDEGGIVLKGSAGDKQFLWIWNDNDTGLIYDSWMANTNLGVDGNTNAIISRVYRSLGYTGVDQSQFIFTAESGKNAEMIFAQTESTNAPLTFTGGTWKITKQNNTNYLVFSSGITGITSDENFLITPGPSGPTYSGVTTYNYAKNLNVDLLDGAHASTASAPFTIPVALSDGKVDSDFINADAIRRRYTQSSHGLTFGQVVRFDTSYGFTSALANTPETAEALGIVSAVHDANNFTVTHQGRITGISGAFMTLEGSSFSAGLVYFLGASGSAPGKLLANPDVPPNALSASQIRKPMLIAYGATQGYVLNHPGSRLTTPTDTVYLRGLVPVGTIYPYAGRLELLVEDWLLCDGDRCDILDYPELFDAIGDTYNNARISFTQTTGSTNTGTIIGGTRKLAVGDQVKITVNSETTVTIQTVNETTGVVTFTPSITGIPETTTYVLKAHQNSSGRRIFFLPDLRSRNIIGSSTGHNYYTTVNNGLTSYSPGNFGGTETITIGTPASSFPAHDHDTVLSQITYQAGSSVLNYVSDIQPGGQITDVPTGLNVIDPYLVTHYIIKAKPGKDAFILTGHNHDNIYHPLHGDMNVTGFASDPYTGEKGQTHGFNVIALTGAAGTNRQQKVILSAFARDASAISSKNSSTELHVRGDLTVFANGLTSPGTTAPIYGEIFKVRTNDTSVFIVGGTGSSDSQYRQSPKLYFINGANTLSNNPTGAIYGLSLTASIVTDDQAVSKYYSDTSDKIIRFSATNENAWRVKNESGNVPNRAQTTIIETYYDNRTNRDNRALNQDRNAAVGTIFFGDITLFGDGTTSSWNLTGHDSRTLTYESRLNRLSLWAPGSAEMASSPQYGGAPAPGYDPGVPNPTIDFVNVHETFLIQDDFKRDNYSPVGTVNGLTAPSYDHQAANKWYVDQSRNRELVNFSMAGGMYTRLFTLRALYHPSRQRGELFRVERAQREYGNTDNTGGGIDRFNYRRMILTAPFDWSYCKLSYTRITIEPESSPSIGNQMSSNSNWRFTPVNSYLIRKPRPSNFPGSAQFSKYKRPPYVNTGSDLVYPPQDPDLSNLALISPYPHRGVMASTFWFGELARDPLGKLVGTSTSEIYQPSTVSSVHRVYDQPSIGLYEENTHYITYSGTQGTYDSGDASITISLTGNTPFDPNSTSDENINNYLQNQNLYLVYGGALYTTSGSYSSNALHRTFYCDFTIEFFKQPIYQNRENYITDLDPDLDGQGSFTT